MATKFNDFSALAQTVWTATDRAGKLTGIMTMIDNCISNNVKKESFRRDARSMNEKKLDKFAADLMLADCDKVIK